MASRAGCRAARRPAGSALALRPARGSRSSGDPWRAGSGRPSSPGRRPRPAPPSWAGFRRRRIGSVARERPQDLRFEEPAEPPAGGGPIGQIHEGRAALLEREPLAVRGAEQAREERPRSGSWPTSAMSRRADASPSAATIPSTLSWASAGSIAGSICLKACAAISAVGRARGSGLVSSTSGRRATRASPRAATRNLALPWGVRGRSSSGTPGVPLGTAVAWRTSRSFIARTLSAPSGPTASGPPGHSDLRRRARRRSHRRTPRRPRRRY